MRIGIDARLYFQTGVGVYLRNLLYYLQKLPTDDLTFYIYLMDEEVDKVFLTKSHFIKRGVPYHWHSVSEQLGFYRTLMDDDLDLIHFTYFSYPVFYSKRFIATVHDVTPLLFKTGKASTKNSLLYTMKHFFFSKILERQVRNAVTVITPTKTVKKQLVELYGESIGKKSIGIYEGVNYEMMNSEAHTTRTFQQRFHNPFFIYVGNFYPHKNVERLVGAFARIKDDIQLILIGPHDFFTRRLAQSIDQLSQSQRVIFYHDPPIEDLIFFYKNALALVHPSLSEGFGLPLVEAMQFNLPIIASTIEVFKEILGEQYLSFDPYKTDDIEKKLKYFLEKKIRFEYGNLLKRYSFEKMTEETLTVYRECRTHLKT